MVEIESVPLAVALLILAALVILRSGRGLTACADQLAHRTGLGEALMGGIVLGAITSLPGITTSVTAAASGHPTLAVANALGGIAAQTVFLAGADVAYRRANLEHAAASVPNMMWSALLIALLAMVLVAMSGPDVSVAGVHPVTPVLLVAYVFGARLARAAQREPMWKPRVTDDTHADRPDPASVRRRTSILWFRLLANGAVVIAAGWLATRAGIAVVARTPLTESLTGGLFLAVTTSLPELVTCIVAVRRGALSLAVGGILGGNAFDTLFAAAADVVHREGSIYHAAGPEERSLAGLGILLTAILLLGLLRRERSGVANIGFESALLIAAYLVGMGTLAVSP